MIIRGLKRHCKTEYIGFSGTIVKRVNDGYFGTMEQLRASAGLGQRARFLLAVAGTQAAQRLLLTSRRLPGAVGRPT
jgi:hypothetical protein